jgi:hypothetical protein
MTDDRTVTWLGRTYTRESVRRAFAAGWNPFLGTPARPGDPRVTAAQRELPRPPS